MNALEHDLIVAAAAVGHQCPSGALAVRMTRCACERLDILEPGSDDSLIVYVEMDASATAATGAVIGRTPLGLRHMTPGDLGRMTVTMIDPRLGRGVRVGVRGPAVSKHRPSESLLSDPEVPDEELLTVTEVRAEEHPPYTPGRALRDVEADMEDHGLAVVRAWQCPGETLAPLNRHGSVPLPTWLTSLPPWPLRTNREWSRHQGLR